MGSTLAARMAGARAAQEPMVRTNRTTASSVAGSFAETP